MLAHAHTLLLPLVALTMLGAASADSAPERQGECRLAYQRAETARAPTGRPEGRLGIETLVLPPGAARAFVTDRRYERSRNDGTRFYGTHLRIAANRGRRPILLRLGLPDWPGGFVQWITPGETVEYQHDLLEVVCPGG